MTDKILKGPTLKCTVNCSMGEFFFKTAERFPDKLCQLDTTLDKVETYTGVRQRSVRVALSLQKRGITSQDVVVSCTKVTLDNVIPIIASFYLGAKLGNLDPSLSVRQTTHLLSLVSPKLIFVEEDSVGLIEESLSGAKLKADIVVFGKSSKYTTFSDLVKPHSNENDFKPTKVDIHDTSVIFFSSGTTGLPKAICHSHYSFLNVAYSYYEADGRCEMVLSFTSFYWVSAMIMLTCSFIGGGCRVFCGPPDAEKTFRAIDKYKVKSLFLAPILTYKLTSFERHHEYDISSLYSIIIGGTPISTVQFERVRSMFKNSHILFVYGLSEAGVVTLFDPMNPEDRKLISTKVGSCGRPAPGLSVKVVDLTTNESLGIKQKGEICVKGPSIMKGYHRVENSTVFDKDGFLKTGDIGYYDEDGCFYVIERLKEMFKYMSWHVVPSAIEAVLLDHPCIKDAVVFGSPRSEEEGEVPTACVVLKDDCKATKEEIEKFVAGKVADYEKLRGGVLFMKELMKTPSGKVMRKEIKNLILK